MAMDIWFECNVRRLPAKGAREKEDRRRETSTRFKFFFIKLIKRQEIRMERKKKEKKIVITRRPLTCTCRAQ